jgi:signal transduction histidine kinase
MSVSMPAPVTDDRSFHVLEAIPSRLEVSPQRPDAAGQLVTDLERAAALIQSFNQVAVDRGGARRRPFNLKLATEQIMTSLRPSLRNVQLSVAIDIPDEIKMDSYPGPYGQALTDLVTNAAVHAFADAQEGHIVIQARPLDRGRVEITLSDDGKGMAAEVQQHAFDPFFTTRRSDGHAGARSLHRP